MKLPAPIKTDIDCYGQVLRLRQNYKSLGFGAFGEVFEIDEHEVLKIGEVDADGYMQFLRYVGLRSANPHFPYVKKIEILDMDLGDPNSNPYYMVRMERLNSINYVEKYDMEHAFDEAGIVDIYDLAEPCRLTPKTRAMVYVKRTLTELFQEYAQDIKWGNVLFRDRTLVITDPVSCYVG